MQPAHAMAFQWNNMVYVVWYSCFRRPSGRLSVDAEEGTWFYPGGHRLKFTRYPETLFCGVPIRMLLPPLCGGRASRRAVTLSITPRRLEIHRFTLPGLLRCENTRLVPFIPFPPACFDLRGIRLVICPALLFIGGTINSKPL